MNLQQRVMWQLPLYSWMFHLVSNSMPTAHAGPDRHASGSSRTKLQAGPVGKAVASAVAKGDSYLAEQYYTHLFVYSVHLYVHSYMLYTYIVIYDFSLGCTFCVTHISEPSFQERLHCCL